MPRKKLARWQRGSPPCGGGPDDVGGARRSRFRLRSAKRDPGPNRNLRLSFTTLRLTLEALVRCAPARARAVAVLDRGTLGCLTQFAHTSGLPAQPLAYKLLIRK